MGTMIEFNFDSFHPTEKPLVKADKFIRLAQSLEAVVLANDCEERSFVGNGKLTRWKFLAIGKGIALKTDWLGPEHREVIERIEAALSPIHADFTGGEFAVESSESLLREILHRLRQLLSAVDDETRGRAMGSMVCTKCGRTIILNEGVQYCPNCGNQHSDRPVSGIDINMGAIGRDLKICRDCPAFSSSAPEDSQKLYHPSYLYCPRCGKALDSVGGDQSDLWLDLDADSLQHELVRGLAPSEYSGKARDMVMELLMPRSKRRGKGRSKRA